MNEGYAVFDLEEDEDLNSLLEDLKRGIVDNSDLAREEIDADVSENLEGYIAIEHDSDDISEVKNYLDSLDMEYEAKFMEKLPLRKMD